MAGALFATFALITYGLDPWGAIGLPLVLMVITVPLLLRSRLAWVDDLGGLLVAGLGLMFIGATLRHISIYEWYERGDAQRYLSVGSEFADQFRSGRIGLGDLLPASRGTAFVEELSGLVQAIVGSSSIGNFMFFAWMAFLGKVALLAAARIAVPNLQIRRYALLVLFLPSMLFWPSSVGKDAWMVLTLGLFCLGAAKLFTRSTSGFLWLALGGVGMTYVRPHLALIAFTAFGVAMVLGRRVGASSSTSGSLALRGFGLLVLVVGFSFAVSQASGLIPGFSPDGGIDLEQTLNETERRSSQGGSEIEVTSPNSPLEYPSAFLTVMFRPLLFEASNFNALLAATESTLLLALGIAWRSQLLAAIRRAFQEPYLMLAGLYTLAFAFAWSSVGNLGIIARQRVQVLPLLVLFLCVPALVKQTRPLSAMQPAEPPTSAS